MTPVPADKLVASGPLGRPPTRRLFTRSLPEATLREFSWDGRPRCAVSDQADQAVPGETTRDRGGPQGRGRPVRFRSPAGPCRRTSWTPWHATSSRRCPGGSPIRIPRRTPNARSRRSPTGSPTGITRAPGRTTTSCRTRNRRSPAGPPTSTGRAPRHRTRSGPPDPDLGRAPRTAELAETSEMAAIRGPEAATSAPDPANGHARHKHKMIRHGRAQSPRLGLGADRLCHRPGDRDDRLLRGPDARHPVAGAHEAPVRLFGDARGLLRGATGAFAWCADEGRPPWSPVAGRIRRYGERGPHLRP